MILEYARLPAASGVNWARGRQVLYKRGVWVVVIDISVVLVCRLANVAQSWQMIPLCSQDGADGLDCNSLPSTGYMRDWARLRGSVSSVSQSVNQSSPRIE